jgi:uncharacterized protein YrrD
MQLQLGADVRLPDGGKLGELVRLVYDLAAQQVHSIVVLRNRVNGGEVLVPVGVIQSADDEAVLLDVDEEQFATFEPFEHTHNLAPPPDAAEVTSDLIHDPVDVPDVAPVGAATGVESIAFTPIVEEDMNVPTGDQVLDRSTTVWATDAEVGHLKAAWVSDQSGQVTDFLAERGLIFPHDTLVPIDLVLSIHSETIVLTVPAHTLENANNDQG